MGSIPCHYSEIRVFVSPDCVIDIIVITTGIIIMIIVGACEINTHLGRACFFNVSISLPLAQSCLKGPRQQLTKAIFYFTGRLHSTCACP